jgi:predicted  nucleic acid-binding Zn-ribbon protein
VKVSCLACGHAWDVAEGALLGGTRCAKCGVAREDHFAQARFVRFESASDPAHERAVTAARAGRLDEAFAALEEALRAGFDPELAAADPALARLRSDPRWPRLFRRSS